MEQERAPQRRPFWIIIAAVSVAVAAAAWMLAYKQGFAAVLRAPSRARSAHGDAVFVVDRPEWAFAFKAQAIVAAAAQLAPSARWRIVLYEDLQETDIDDAGWVLLFWWQLTVHAEWAHLHPVLLRNADRVYLGVCSHTSIGQSYRSDWAAKFIELIGSTRFAGVFANSVLLAAEAERLVHRAGARVPVWYTPNGVDTTTFHPRPDAPLYEPQALRVGWAGSLADRQLPGGLELKGVRTVIAPAVHMLAPGAAALHIAAPHVSPVRRHDMPEFMRGLGVYVCASVSEGTPNPALEAAASAVPVLSTAVGNMPELLLSGANGYIAQRTPEAFARRLAVLAGCPGLQRRLALSARQTVQQWSWQEHAAPFVRMLAAPKSATASAATFAAQWQQALSVQAEAAAAMRPDTLRTAVLQLLDLFAPLGPVQVLEAGGDAAPSPAAAALHAIVDACRTPSVAAPAAAREFCLRRTVGAVPRVSTVIVLASASGTLGASSAAEVQRAVDATLHERDAALRAPGALRIIALWAPGPAPRDAALRLAAEAEAAAARHSGGFAELIAAAPVAALAVEAACKGLLPQLPQLPQLPHPGPLPISAAKPALCHPAANITEAAHRVAGASPWLAVLDVGRLSAGATASSPPLPPHAPRNAPHDRESRCTWEDLPCAPPPALQPARLPWLGEGHFVAEQAGGKAMPRATLPLTPARAGTPWTTLLRCTLLVAQWQRQCAWDPQLVRRSQLTPARALITDALRRGVTLDPLRESTHSLARHSRLLYFDHRNAALMHGDGSRLARYEPACEWAELRVEGRVVLQLQTLHWPDLPITAFSARCVLGDLHNADAAPPADLLSRTSVLPHSAADLALRANGSQQHQHQHHPPRLGPLLCPFVAQAEAATLGAIVLV